MSLTQLKVSQLRCLKEAELALGPHLNLIYGANGSGKTSLLEAAFLVGSRAVLPDPPYRQPDCPARRPPDRCLPRRRIRPTGSDLSTAGTRPTRRAWTVVMCRAWPSCRRHSSWRSLIPRSTGWWRARPAERRRWLDWGVFHVEPAFLEHWTAIQSGAAPAQRGPAAGPGSASLGGRPDRPWGAGGGSSGPVVRRPEAVLAGSHQATVGTGAGPELLPRLVSGPRSCRCTGRGMGTRPGAGRHAGLDRNAQMSSCGWEGRRPGRVFHAASKSWWRPPWCWRCCSDCGTSRSLRRHCLLDDPAAELDAQRLGALVELVTELNCQLLITSLSPDQRIFGQPERVFHVEHGAVQGVY